MRGFVLFGLVLVGTTSYAQDDSYGYVGLGAGVFGHAVEIPNEGFPFTISDNSTATRLFGGWKVNEHLAIEGSFGQTGDLNWSGAVFVGNSTGVFGPDPGVTLDAVARADWTIATLSVLGHINWFFAGVGWYELDGSFVFDADCSCGPGVFNIANDSSTSDFLFTLGAQWSFERWAIRGQYELYDTEGTAQDAIYLGVSLNF